MKGLTRLRGRSVAPAGKPAPAKRPSGAHPYRQRREPIEYARLVRSPVFVLCAERSGSTLLQAVLNAHSRIHAPHELHLRQLKVQVSKMADLGMADLGFSARELENVLWDRMLHVRLVASGKHIIVDKTPHNVRGWRRIHDYWPEARFIFLYRHPQRIYESMTEAWPRIDPGDVESRLVDMLTELRAASSALPGLEIRYERLTGDPAAVTRELCSHLGVAWEPDMLRYEQANAEARWEKFLGDWGENIKSGEIKPDKPLPTRAEISAGLLEVTEATGYPS